jgi:uncharacterized cupin superfamily protein
MSRPRVIKGSDAPVHPLHGEGRIRKLIYPDIAGSQRLFVGIAEVGPGEAPHVFHRHDTEIHDDTRIDYAPEFEEFYFVVEGSGTMQWIAEDGSRGEEPVVAGDAVYMAPGTDAHRIMNTGSTRLRVLYGGTPPAQVTKLA